MSRIEHFTRSIREDQRITGPHLWPVKTAASALDFHANTFTSWWLTTKHRLKRLYHQMPGETAAELAALIAEAEAERQDHS